MNKNEKSLRTMREARSIDKLALAKASPSKATSIEELGFQYPFSVCPQHFTGRGFRIEKSEARDLYHSEIRVLTYDEFCESLVPANLIHGKALELLDSGSSHAKQQYEIINKAFLEFLHFLETARWDSGYQKIYSEMLFRDLKAGNTKIGLSLRIFKYYTTACDNQTFYKVFCKLWK